MTTPRVGVIIRHEEKYLCVFQDASKLWGFPKGRLKEYESYRVGACRELMEETNIKIYPTFLDTNNLIHIKRGKHHHYYFLYNVQTRPSVVVDCYEIIDHKWMTIDEICNVKTSFFTEQAIKRLKSIKTTEINKIPE